MSQFKDEMHRLMDFYRKIVSLDISVITLCNDHRIMELTEIINEQVDSLEGKQIMLHIQEDYNLRLEKQIKNLKKRISKEDDKIAQLTQELGEFKIKCAAERAKAAEQHLSELTALQNIVQETPAINPEQLPATEVFTWLSNELNILAKHSPRYRSVHAALLAVQNLERELAQDEVLVHSYARAFQQFRNEYTKPAATFTSKQAALISCMQLIKNQPGAHLNKLADTIIETLTHLVATSRGLAAYGEERTTQHFRAELSSVRCTF